MNEHDDVEVVASGAALSHVSKWLGESAESILEKADESIEEMFENPRPLLLGLGAKYLSHKSLEKSGIEMKLKHRLKQSVEANGDCTPAYHAAQLDRHQQHQRKRKHETQSSAQVQQQTAEARHDSEDEGKLSCLKHPRSKSGQTIGQKAFNRQQLLAVPVEHLSKWQRKRMRQKVKQQQQQ